jgi:hypothetical protein
MKNFLNSVYLTLRCIRNLNSFFSINAKNIAKTSIVLLKGLKGLI